VGAGGLGDESSPVGSRPQGQSPQKVDRHIVLDAQTQNGDEPVGEYSFLGQSCLSSADSC